MLPGLVAQGFLPVFDDHQSNYVAVLVGGPLAFRVAYLPHDEGSRLLYRDIDSFLQALIEALNGDPLACRYFHDTQGDYPPDAPRNQTDQCAAGPDGHGWNAR